MNARLKQIAAERGMTPQKLAETVAIFGERGTEEMLLSTIATEKTATQMNVAFKVVQGDPMGTPRQNGLVAREADQLDALCADLSEADVDQVWAVYIPRGFKEAASEAMTLKARRKAAQMDPFEFLVKNASWDGR